MQHHQHTLHQHQHISHRQHQRGQRPSPITQRHPQIARPPRPTQPVPTLQRYAMYPAGFLTHRLRQFSRKIAARGDQLPCFIAQADEPAAPACPRDQQPQFIILGQAFSRKRAHFALGQPDRADPLQHRPTKAAADPRRRQPRAQRAAHHQRLGMRFDKFVAIMARNPMVAPRHFRPHQYLHEVRRFQRPADHFQLARVDHILSIMQHNACKIPTHPRLISHHCAIETVEAIGLGGGPQAVMDNQPHPHIAPRTRHGGAQRCRVIAIAAHIDPHIAPRPCAAHMHQRRPDDRCFMPSRDQHRQRPATIARRLAPINQRRQTLSAPSRIDPQRQPDRINRQFIDHPNDKPEQCKQQKLALNDLKPLSECPNRMGGSRQHVSASTPTI